MNVFLSQMMKLVRMRMNNGEEEEGGGVQWDTGLGADDDGVDDYDGDDEDNYEDDDDNEGLISDTGVGPLHRLAACVCGQSGPSSSSYS